MSVYFRGLISSNFAMHPNANPKANSQPSLSSKSQAIQPDKFQRAQNPHFGHNFEPIATPQPSPLLTAVEQKDNHKAQHALQEAHANPNETDANGNTLISIAARNGDLPMAKLLLDNGAATSVNQPGAQYGDTPLYWAAVMDCLPLAQLLLEHGAAQSVNVADTVNGRTPLFYSVNHNNVDMTQLLLENGAAESVNSTNPNLQTPLYMAVNHNNPTLVGLLLQYGAAATIDHFNPDGNTALNAAIRKQNPEIAFMLLAHGAHPQLVPTYFKSSLKAYLISRLNQVIQRLPHAPDTTPKLQVLHQLNACRQVLRVYNAVWPNGPMNTFPQDSLDHIAETAGAVGYLEAALDAYRAGAHEAVAGRSVASQAIGTLLPAGTTRSTMEM